MGCKVARLTPLVIDGRCNGGGHKRGIGRVDERIRRKLKGEKRLKNESRWSEIVFVYLNLRLGISLYYWVIGFSLALNELASSVSTRSVLFSTLFVMTRLNNILGFPLGK